MYVFIKRNCQKYSIQKYNISGPVGLSINCDNQRIWWEIISPGYFICAFLSFCWLLLKSNWQWWALFCPTFIFCPAHEANASGIPFLPRLANVNRHRTRNFFASVRETRVSRQTNGRALYDLKANCAFVIRLGDFIGSSLLVRSCDRTIDLSIVRPQLMSRSDFSLPVVFVSIAIFFFACFRSTVYLCAFFPALISGFRPSLYIFFLLLSPYVCYLLPANSLSVFYRNFVWGKNQILPQFLNIKVFISLLKGLLSIQSFCNRIYVHVHAVQSKKKIVQCQFHQSLYSTCNARLREINRKDFGL